MNRVLVIVVTYNGMKWIDRCFESIRQSAEPLDVFVVDNCSTDGTVSRIKEIAAELSENGTALTFIESKENLGFGRANNIGLEHALKQGYEYVYLLNEDAWIFPDTVPALLSAFESNPGYGVLSPVQITASGDRLDPRFDVKCSRYLPADPLAQKGAVYSVPFVMAAHWMISRECLLKVGGFSPAFQHYGEDDNFLHRCRWKGFGIGVVCGIKAVHDRELRPNPKDRRMRLKCVASVVKVSDPNAFLPWRMVRQPLELLGISIIYLSADVFRFIFRLIVSYPHIIRYRRESRESDCPFLHWQ